MWSDYRIAKLGGLHCTEVEFLRLTQQPQVRFMAFPENVDRTHLVLVREASKYKKNSLILFGSASHVLGSEYNLTKWVFLRNKERGTQSVFILLFEIAFLYLKGL